MRARTAPGKDEEDEEDADEEEEEIQEEGLATQTMHKKTDRSARPELRHHCCLRILRDAGRPKSSWTLLLLVHLLWVLCCCTPVYPPRTVLKHSPG